MIILPYLIKFGQLLLKAFHLARTKITTYVALATAGLNELINNWEGAKALLPPPVIAHRAEIVSASVLLAIWSRIRREL